MQKLVSTKPRFTKNQFELHFGERNVCLTIKRQYFYLLQETFFSYKGYLFQFTEIQIPVFLTCSKNKDTMPHTYSKIF